MRGVASKAAFTFYSGVLEHERSARLSVALSANRIHIGGGLDVVVSEGSMNIMAVAALHQAFIHLVVKGHSELRLDICVALEAELRLRRLQQIRLGIARVYAVATRAAYPGLGMRRPLEVWMRA